MPDHRHRGGRPQSSRGIAGLRDGHGIAVLGVGGDRGRQVGGVRRQEPADARTDAAGRVPSAGQPAAVYHVAETGAAGGVRRQRHHGPGGRPGPVPDGARPEAGPGGQHGLVFHQQADAGR